LLLTALDVPRDTVMQDFLASNDAVDVERMSTMLARVFSAQSGTPVDARAVRPMLTVEPIYLETAFATIEDRYGTVDRYLAEALGLDAQKRLRLTQLLLD
jgi:protein-tyrosine phosphatase